MRDSVIDKPKKTAILRKRVSTVQPGTEKAFDPVVIRAIAVIGNMEAALRWMGTPVKALEYATPVSLLGTDEGAQKVMSVLDQLEHGVY